MTRPQNQEEHHVTKTNKRPTDSLARSGSADMRGQSDTPEQTHTQGQTHTSEQKNAGDPVDVPAAPHLLTLPSVWRDFYESVKKHALP